MNRSPSPELIRRVRERASLTRDAAAKLIYCSARSWEKWETGERRMHPAWWELFKAKL